MITSAALVLFAWAAPVNPAPAVERPAPELNVYYETDFQGLRFTANLYGALGGEYALIASMEGVPPVMLGRAEMGEPIVFKVREAYLEDLPAPVRLFAAFYRGRELTFTKPADLVLGREMLCEELNFNYKIGSDREMLRGRQITDEWVDMGMLVSARNNVFTHPDKAILFDTADITGGDTDLLTPNPAGFNNDVAFGKVLIVAENDRDLAPVDNFVDDPDDEAGGGSIYFDFEGGAAICSVTLLDIDEKPGTELRFYRDGDFEIPDETLSVFSLGDGSVQEVNFAEFDVDRFEVYFAGSGAVARADVSPCPRMVNFDETTTGVPMVFRAGERMEEQYAVMGLHISARNNHGSHPDMAILFDSENPTGGDFDLLTPNPLVPGNDTPLGYVMIIAENDVDVAPFDGYVDDPDDEATGGVMTFRFDSDVLFLSAHVLDVDGKEFDFWRFYDKDGFLLAPDIVIPDLPDGNVQVIQPFLAGVRTAELHLGGSGAVTRLQYCIETPPPCGQPPVVPN